MASYQEVKLRLLRLLSRHEKQDLSLFADLFATDPDLPFIWPFLNLDQEFLSYWFVISVSCKIKSLGAKPSMMNYWAVRILKKKQTNTSTTKLDDVSINLRECIPFSTVSLTKYVESWDVLDIVWLFGGFQQRRCESAVGRLTPFSFFLSFSESCASVVPPSCGPQQTTEREIIKFKNLSNS